MPFDYVHATEQELFYRCQELEREITMLKKRIRHETTEAIFSVGLDAPLTDLEHLRYRLGNLLELA
jgi:hypothetical protein